MGNMNKVYKHYRNLDYVITYPNEFDENKKYPVIIFLHGAGTRGNNINKLSENPFYNIIEKYEDFNFITTAPLCCKNTWFDVFENIIDFAEFVSKQSYICQERVYLMGASMGGYAVWQLAMSRPDIFAAIVPICGGGMYWNAERLKNIPIWAFHGADDNVVFLDESKKMIEAVNRTGGNAKLTIYDNCGHDAWTKTYSNHDVFKWLLSNKKSVEKQLSDNKFNDSEIYG